MAREKVVDYVTKIYSASIRNMSGTRPHLQHKELPVEERYHEKTSQKHHTVLPYLNLNLNLFPVQASCEPGCTAA